MQLGIKSNYRAVRLCKLSQSEETMIPSDWAVKWLKDIVRINCQSINEEYDQKAIQYIDISSVENYQIKKYEYLDLKERPSRAQRIVEKGDILVSTVRPYLRGFTRIKDSKPNLICSTGFTVLRSEEAENTEFIFSCIKSHYFETNIIRHMEGMAYPAVTSKIVGNSLIPWPTSRIERIKIGSVLLKVDELVQKIDQIIEQTQRLKKGLVQKLLTRGIGHTEYKEVTFYDNKISIPVDWLMIRLSDYTTKIGSGITPLGGSSVYVKQGIPLIRSQNVHFDGLRLDDVAYITQETHNEMSRTKLKDNDVLLNITGASVGRCTVIPNGFGEGNVNQHVCIIRPKDDVDPFFLSLFLSSKLGQDIIFRSFSGLSREGLNFKEIGSFQILLPPKLEQKEIADMIFSVNSQINKEKVYKQGVEQLKKGLMQKLLTGKIRVKV